MNFMVSLKYPIKLFMSMFKNFISIFMVVLAVLMTTSVFSQNLVPCNCNATVKIETESCATHQSDHDIAFYIYDPEASKYLSFGEAVCQFRCNF